MSFLHYESDEQLEKEALKLVPKFMKDKLEGNLINIDVLKFIVMFTNCDAKDYKDSTTQLFQGGLCYYFATLLKNEFGGSIVFKKFGGHIAWMDSSGIIYDSFGIVFDYEEGDWLPIELMDSIELDGFKHLVFHTLIDDTRARLKTARNILEYEKTNGASEKQIILTQKVINFVETAILTKSVLDNFNKIMSDRINAIKESLDSKETNLF